jgi:methionyl-tRNA formyltransferase
VKIAIVCSDPHHPVVPHLQRWRDEQRARKHAVELRHDVQKLSGGDMLFLVSCTEVVKREIRARFKACLVLHASDLPRGRGWSPYVWLILQGKNEITVTLLEAADRVDTGDIWLQEPCHLEGHELLPEIREKLFRCELALMSRAVDEFGTIRPIPQRGEPGPYLRRRTLEDSRLDARKSLAEQFDLLRVVDPQRYPAFFELRGHRYIVRIEKDSDRE